MQNLNYLNEQDALGLLKTEDGRLLAAWPGYREDFLRDAITYGLLADDLDSLEKHIDFASNHQGEKIDPITGEVPGKFHHQIPGVEVEPGYLTTYNACDTTALYLLAVDHLVKSGREYVLDKYRDNIERAIGYIKGQVKHGLFWETPPSGAERFSLKVTYWKDSELNHPKKIPVYPISYSLVHFQNLAAIHAISNFYKSKELQLLEVQMLEAGMDRFWRGDHFAVAIDGEGEVIDAPSSDSLEILAYLEPDQLEKCRADAIVEYSKQLETEYGYLPALVHQDVDDVDPYHVENLWVHLQALLHLGGVKHKQPRIQEVSQRMVDIFDGRFPELRKKTGEPAGNEYQLFAIGSALYFRRIGGAIVHGEYNPRESVLVS